MKDIKNTIVTLGNGNMYYVYDEHEEKSGTYELIINVNDEEDVEIVKKEENNNEIYLTEIDDNSKIESLMMIFKSKQDI